MLSREELLNRLANLQRAIASVRALRVLCLQYEQRLRCIDDPDLRLAAGSADAPLPKVQEIAEPPDILRKEEHV